MELVNIVIFLILNCRIVLNLLIWVIFLSNLQVSSSQYYGLVTCSQVILVGDLSLSFYSSFSYRNDHYIILSSSSDRFIFKVRTSDYLIFDFVFIPNDSDLYDYYLHLI